MVGCNAKNPGHHFNALAIHYPNAESTASGSNIRELAISTCLFTSSPRPTCTADSSAALTGTALVRSLVHVWPCSATFTAPDLPSHSPPKQFLCTSHTSSLAFLPHLSLPPQILICKAGLYRYTLLYRYTVLLLLIILYLTKHTRSHYAFSSTQQVHPQQHSRIPHGQDRDRQAAQHEPTPRKTTPNIHPWACTCQPGSWCHSP
jgi:hypothetical protein